MQIQELHSPKKEIFWQVKDRHYMSLWDAKDLPTIEKWQEKIRATHDEQLIRDFFQLLDKKYDDHRNLKVEPLQLALKDDVLTYKGVAKICRLVTRQDLTTFTHVAVGTGAPAGTQPLPFEENLYNEDYKVAFVQNGFFDAAGASIRYSGTFGATVASENYNESLVRNVSDEGDSGKVVLCISQFDDDDIAHTSGNTGFTCAGSIEFTIIADSDV